jgi:hypothetical protein
MKTAGELFKDYAELCQFEEGPNEYMVDKESFIEALNEFAKAHIQQFANEFNLSTDYRKHLVDNYIKKSRNHESNI